MTACSEEVPTVCTSFGREKSKPPVGPSPDFWQKLQPGTLGKGVLAAFQPAPLPSTTQLGPRGRKCSQKSQGDAGEDTGYVIPVLGLDVHLQAIAT